MGLDTSLAGHIDDLIKAFSSDHYDVNLSSDVVTFNKCVGIRATHKTAVIGTTGKKKKAFYVEGDPHTQGYLMGLLAEPDIERMCTEYNRNVVFDFISWQIEDPLLRELLGKILEDIIFRLAKGIYQDIPSEYVAELEGMLDGCKEVHQQTKVDREGLWVLNVGIDAILSFVNTGLDPHNKPYKIEIKPDMLRVPIMCNAFAVSGVDRNTGKKYHYLGRDFMFPTAGAFQDTATMIMRKPSQGIPTVSVAAPGMIGTIAGVNRNGVGVGVDMQPSNNCNSSRPGFNSLLLTRHSIQYGNTCTEAVNVIIDAQRGVPWDYVLADGIEDKACIVEAGEKTQDLDFMSYVEEWAANTLKSVDPNFEDRLEHPSVPVRQGAMVRWNDYSYPSAYQSFNQQLIEAYRKLHPHYTYKYKPEDFGERGYINKRNGGKVDSNCPGPFYFAPQRETLPSLVLVSNHYVIPEMRLCAMNFWTALISSGNLNDIQWRYDELNYQLLTRLEKGPMTYNDALEIIDYLAPNRKFPDYYNERGEPLNKVVVHGSVSLIDLKEITIESHYGYYSDEWIKLDLKKYV